MIKKEFGELDGYTIRLVSTPDELKEKIMLRDSHIDDRVLELMKQYYAVNALEKNPELEFVAVLFNRGLTEHEIVLVTKNHQKLKAELNLEILDNLKKLYEKKINEMTKPGCNIINAQWAGHLLETKH